MSFKLKLILPSGHPIVMLVNPRANLCSQVVNKWQRHLGFFFAGVDWGIMAISRVDRSHILYFHQLQQCHWKIRLREENPDSSTKGIAGEASYFGKLFTQKWICRVLSISLPCSCPMLSILYLPLSFLFHFPPLSRPIWAHLPPP